MQTSKKQFFTMRTTMMKLALVVSIIASGGAIALATGGSSSLQQATTNSETGLTDKQVSVYEWIKNSIHCPDFVGQKKQTVELWLHVDAAGQLQVLEVKSDDPKLIEYVQQQVDKKTLDLPIDEVNKDYHFVLRFQTI